MIAEKPRDAIRIVFTDLCIISLKVGHHHHHHHHHLEIYSASITFAAIGAVQKSKVKLGHAIQVLGYIILLDLYYDRQL